jgi:hypothetical protein
MEKAKRKTVKVHVPLKKNSLVLRTIKKEIPYGTNFTVIEVSLRKKSLPRRRHTNGKA